jgi:hypothetical protein
MSELLQSVLGALEPQRVDAMARQIGASPQQTQRAIHAALPLLIGQMARNSAEPQGAQSLHGALQRDHAGVDLGGLLGSVLGGMQGSSRGAPAADGGGLLGSVLGAVLGGGSSTSNSSSDPLSDGAAILGHIFGQRQPRVAQGVAQVGGLDGAQSNRLLAMLAPIVMAVLARMMQNRGGGSDALGGLLGGEARQVRQQDGGLLGAVLDRDGDGDVDLSDLLQNGQLLGGLFGRR